MERPERNLGVGENQMVHTWETSREPVVCNPLYDIPINYGEAEFACALRSLPQPQQRFHTRTQVGFGYGC